MEKVHISTTCEYCHGLCRLPDGQDVDWQGQPFTRYKPCPVCQGGGRQGKWVTLEEFAHMLISLIQPESQTKKGA